MRRCSSPSVSGVYSIRQIGTNRIYVGSSWNVKLRWAAHRGLLRRGQHHSHFLQRAWDKYGEEAFEVSLIEKCERQELVLREQVHLDALKPAFNVCPIARSRRGSKYSPALLERMRYYWKSTVKTHCKHGHEYTAQNTYIGKRRARLDKRCKTCNRERVGRIRATQTGIEREERLAHMRSYHMANRDKHNARMRAYGAAKRAANLE